MLFLERCANILRQSRDASKYPGVAKFGIALEWGSRGRWFESSHSDQKRSVLGTGRFFYAKKLHLFDVLLSGDPGLMLMQFMENGS